MSEYIRDIVESQLCCQCGTCVAVCPTQAIEMRETPSGMLVAFIDEDGCTSCGKCRRFCPGGGITLNLPSEVDPFEGPVYSAYVGHASDESVRRNGQSGGVVSALLLFLIETNQIDAALITKMSTDGSLRPTPTLARTRPEILSGQGSKYCPVASNAVLRDIAADLRIATVGIPCQIHGINHLAQHGNRVAAGVQYRIGLFCDRTLLYTCIEQMASEAGLAMKDIAALEYRSKARNGWPGEVCFRFHTGESYFFPPSLRKQLKEPFTLPRCRLCFDKTNVLSDISVGDGWGIDESPAGTSVILVRNAKGDELIKESLAAGFIGLKEIAPQRIFEAQGLDIRRKNFVAFLEAWHMMGRLSPEYKWMDQRFLPPAAPNLVSACRRKLALNCRISAGKTKAHTLAIVRRHMRIWRSKSLASWIIKSMQNRMKALLHRGDQSIDSSS